jgi:hypothetical protein
MRLEKIEDINPNSFYNTSAFYLVKYNNGASIIEDIYQGKKSGRLPYTKESTAHILLGSDVIAFLNGTYDLIRSTEQAAKDKLKTLSDNELLDTIIENKRLTDSHKRMARELKIVTKENNRYKEEMKSIKRLYQKRDLIETKRKADVLDHINGIIFGNSSIKKISSELLLCCGIYFLIKENAIVYVGQSVNVAARIVAHKNDGKDFDEVRFIKCKKEVLDEREMFFIRLLKPELNGEYKNRNDENIFKVILNTD